MQFGTSDIHFTDKESLMSLHIRVIIRIILFTKASKASKILQFLSLLIFLSTSVFAQIDNSFFVETDEGGSLLSSYEDYRRMIIGIPERFENRPGAEQMLAILQNFAEKRNISWQLYDIEERGDFFSFGKNLCYSIPAGQSEELAYINPNTRGLVFFIPYVYSNNKSNAGILAGILSLLDSLEIKLPAMNIEFCFLGSIDESKGLREYINRFKISPPDFAMYLTSYDSLTSDLFIENGDKNTLTPRFLFKWVREILFRYRLDTTAFKTQLYRLGLASENNLSLLLRSNLNAIGIHFLESSESFLLGNTLLSLLYGPEIADFYLSSLPSLYFLNDLIYETNFDRLAGDTHYLDFSVFFIPIIISEEIYLIITFSVCSLFIVYLVLSQRSRKKLTTVNLRNITQILLLSISMLASLLLVSSIIPTISTIRRIDTLLGYIPLPLFIFKLAGTMFFFSIFALAIRNVGNFLLNRESNFVYITGSRFFSIFGLIFFAAININFFHYFLWIFLFLWFASIVTKSTWKILNIIIAYLPTVLLLTRIFAAPQLLEALISARVDINILIAIIILPPIFICLDIIFVRDRKFRFQQKVLIALLTVFFFTSLIVTLTIPVFTNNQKQEIEIIQYANRKIPFFSNEENIILSDPDIDGSAVFYTKARSNAPLGSISLTDYTFPENLRENNHDLPQKFRPQSLRFRADKNTIFDRSQYNFTFETIGFLPEKFEIFLYVDTSTPVYLSNLPYIIRSSSGGIEFLTGINPPNPLGFEFTIPSDIFPILEVTVQYSLQDNIHTEKQQFKLTGTETIQFVETSQNSQN